ncbi:MAG: hypothetical protein F4146_06795 [Rhodothermaceae bacterium]|nr:hypothetical protein [Rhodothermaceae bacterium]
MEVSFVEDKTTVRHFLIPSVANSTGIRLFKALGLTILRQTKPVENDPQTAKINAIREAESLVFNALQLRK